MSVAPWPNGRSGVVGHGVGDSEFSALWAGIKAHAARENGTMSAEEVRDLIAQIRAELGDAAVSAFSDGWFRAEVAKLRRRSIAEWILGRP